MKVTIKHSYDSAYSEWESVEVIVDGKLVATVRTASDSPEDNNISRLNIVAALYEAMRAVAPGQEIETLRVAE